jgi:putative transposase
MIDPTHTLPLVRQAQLLELSRSNVYYFPRPVPDADLVLMRRIDELHLNFPFAGSRMLRDLLRLEGLSAGRKHVRTLMAKMGITAIYRKPKTSVAHPAHRIYPYLLHDLVIDRPNQVWAADICYIPMQRGFLYLVAIIDWATRKVLAHRVSISMSADFCVEALQEAIAKYGAPEIFNTDQGSQFTGEHFTGVLKQHQIKISMDGKGRWVDNVFVERLWRSLKYEHVYLHAYASVAQAQAGIAAYLDFFNHARPHSSLGAVTPDTAYFATALKPLQQAA